MLGKLHVRKLPLDSGRSAASNAARHADLLLCKWDLGHPFRHTGEMQYLWEPPFACKIFCFPLFVHVSRRFLLFQLFLSVKTLESIISVPLVQKSRESNVPAWLAVPTIGCVVCGMLYSFSSTSVLNTQSDARTETSWIGPLFIAAGGMSLYSGGLLFHHGRFLTCLNSFLY